MRVDGLLVAFVVVARWAMVVAILLVALDIAHGVWIAITMGIAIAGSMVVDLRGREVTGRNPTIWGVPQTDYLAFACTTEDWLVIAVVKWTYILAVPGAIITAFLPVW